MAPDFSDQSIVVTGGSSGIGAAVVDALIQQGATVTVLDRREPQSAADFIYCDLTDEAALRQACAACPDRIDGLANVAGASGMSGPETAFTVNYLGLRDVVAHLMPRMNPGGSIVNVASTAGSNWRLRTDLLHHVASLDSRDQALTWLRDRNLSGTAAYDFSKEIVVYYSQQLALARFAADGIRVNTVSPGPVETPLLGEFKTTMGEGPLRQLREAVGRDGHPAEVAAVVLFLLGPQSVWVNGADIPVDGGAEAAFNTGLLRSSRTAAMQIHA